MKQGKSARPTLALYAIGVALVVTAVVFTETLTTDRVADNAIDLHWANATTGVSATARAAVVQANVLIAGAELGIVDPEPGIRALDEARIHAESLSHWIDLQPVSDTETSLAVALGAYSDSLSFAISALDEADTAGAAAILNGPLEQSWGTLELELEVAQKDAVDRVVATEGFAALLGLVTRITLTLIIPATAIAIYRYRARQQFEAARRTFESEIETQRRLGEAKNHLIAGVSHELRTPLTTILGFSDVLVGSTTDPEIEEMAGLINTDARRLRRMVDDFVAATRLSEESVSPSLEAASVRDLVEFEAAAFSRDTDIHLNIAPATAFADRNHIGQILRNLISNAVEHGGDTVWASGEVRGGGYRLAISDDGPGIEGSQLDRTFEPFSHDGLEAVTAGSVGLGLYVARGLARAQGGDLMYVRTDGWTHFIVSLALAQEQAPTAEAGGSAMAQAG